MIKTRWNDWIANRLRSHRWFLAARLAVFILMLLMVGIFITGVVEYPRAAAAHPEILTTWNWTPQEMDVVMGHIGQNFQDWTRLNLVIMIASAVVVCGIGFFLFIRKNGDWFGLYLAASFVLFGTLSGFSPVVVATIHPVLEPLLTPLGVFAWVSLLLILFIFPNGRFEPGWTRWVGISLFIAYGIDIIFYDGRTPPPLLLILIMSLVAVGPASQVYRYRKVSNVVERQQTRLVMQAIVLVIAGLMLSFIPMFAPETINPMSPSAVIMGVVSSIYPLVMGLIPLSIAQAVLRYHLWDIDLIIRRTLVYGVLTFLLGILYFGLVTLLQALFAGFSQQQSPLGVVLSTLVIAALFTPLRRRIQGFIDRRFYRQKYDAERAMLTFSTAARSEVELNVLADQLMSVARESLHPESLSLWLRK